MVTMVPPDSGPRMGLSESTEGFFGKKQRNAHNLHTRLDLGLEGGPALMVGGRCFCSFRSPVLSASCWRVSPGKAEGCALELMNSLGSLMLITLRGKWSDID